MVVVAQLVRALVCGTKGRGFESRLPPEDDKKASLLSEAFFVIFIRVKLETSWKLYLLQFYSLC